MTASALLGGSGKPLSKYVAHALTGSAFPLASKNTNNYLRMTGKTDLSVVITFRVDSDATDANPIFIGALDKVKDMLLDLRIHLTSSRDAVSIRTHDRSGGIINEITCGFPKHTFAGKWRTLLINISATDSMKTYARLGDFNPPRTIITPDGQRAFRNYKKFYLGGYDSDGECDVGEVYAVDEDIDFADPEILALFVDRKGWQQDLQPAIDVGLIPQPLVHMTYKDTANLGKNSGTLGDLSVNASRTTISKIVSINHNDRS